MFAISSRCMKLFTVVACVALSSSWITTTSFSASAFVFEQPQNKQQLVHNHIAQRQCRDSRTLLFESSTSSSSTIPPQSRAAPRTGILQSLLNMMLESPLYQYVLVPQARRKMEDTAAANGIPWVDCRAWLESQCNAPWSTKTKNIDDDDAPEYYQKPFHAYERGNLCWDAALEVEIASCAVGARNFPKFGRRGETAFRESFDAALKEGGANCEAGAIIVDLGCGTGISTRRLAKQYPHANSIIGIDLSPYYINVGKFLLDLAPVKSIEEGGPWVNAIETDDRIQYRTGNAAHTALPDNSVDVVNLQFVAHEMPWHITCEVIKEAHRILKNDGQLWFCEMDFETPGYAAQRANALLFSLIRSTEPYLDDYADHAVEIRECLQQQFASVVVTPATGRHFSIVATKNSNEDNHVFIDNRFDEFGEYRVEDTHLKTFENDLRI